MTHRPPTLQHPGLLLALPDWESDLPERLVSAFVALSRRVPAVLMLGVPTERPAGSDYEGRVVSELMACGINPSLDPIELELFDAPDDLAALGERLEAATLVWSAGNPGLGEAARSVARYTSEALDVDALEWDLWLSQPLDPQALACYRPEDVAAFCLVPEAMRFPRVRLDRLPWGGFNACVFCHHTGDDRRMAWYFVEVLGQEGDRATIRLPDYLSGMPLAVREKLERELGTILRAIDANPENRHIVSLDIKTEGAIPLPPSAHDEGIGLLHERHLPYTKRYWLAQALCRDGDVLDLNPEAGYGSRMLALAARQVTALATDAETAAYAESLYGTANLAFRSKGEGNALPFADAAFDAVVSLEGLADLDWAALDPTLDEVRRVLRPAGNFVVSLPNPDIFVPDSPQAQGPRLRADEFEALLRSHFAQVRLLSQWPSRHGGFDVGREYAIVPGHDRRKKSFVAICAQPRGERAPLRLGERQHGLRLLSLGGPAGTRWLLEQSGHSVTVAPDPRALSEALGGDSFDLVLGHAPEDLPSLEALGLPALYLVHGEAGRPETSALRRFVEERRGLCAAASLATLEELGVTGLVLPLDGESEGFSGMLHRLAKWEEAFAAAQEVHQTRRQLDALYLRLPEAPKAERPLRILIATVSSAFSTSAYFARAFRKEGCDVLTVGPMLDKGELSRIKATSDQHALKAEGSADKKVDLLSRLTKPCDVPFEPGQADVREILKALPSGWSPDLFIWVDSYTAFMPVGFEHLPCPAVCFIGDSHQRLDWRLDYAKQFDHVFVMFNRHHVPYFERAGCRNVGWLPAACDPDVHIWTAAEKAYDVGFIGQTLRQWYPDRVRLLERLMAAGIDVHVETQILQEMALVFNRSRLIFNRSIREDLNMRVFEAMATGSLLLTNRLPQESGQELLFKDREHLVIYDEDDLEAIAKYYLAHEDEREAIAARGRAEVLAHHTYRHRARQVLMEVGLGRAGAPSTTPQTI